MNITNITSPDNSCIGCGICVSLCPTKHLLIKKNNYNQLAIFEKDNRCIDKCSICIDTCPFSNSSDSESAISLSCFNTSEKYNNITGYYINSYVGYNPNNDKRMNSASGGLTSYLLEYLLKSKEVDAVLIVGRDKESYFKYQVCTKYEDVYNFSRSAYTVVNIDKGLSDIINNDNINSFAVVALPCFSKALRNATKYNAKLRKKLKYIIGLVCGQQKSNNFVEYLSSKFNVEKLSGIDFRTKKYGRPNGNFGVKMYYGNDKEKEIVFSDYAKEWSFKMFSVPVCNLCDDIFAETADIVFMDAWLPEFRQSDKGENLIITRNKELDNIISSLKTVKEIGIERVIKSQEFVVKNKRVAIKKNINISQKIFPYTPQKRVGLCKSPNFFEKFLYSIKYHISLNSDKLWIESGRNYSDFICQFNKKYRIKLFIGLLLNKINSLYNKIHK